MKKDQRVRMVVISTIISYLIVSSLSATPSVAADPIVTLPETGAPTIDGNVTTLEWKESLKFESEIDGQSASVFVTSNNSKLYIGVNFTQSEFVELNMTIPSGAPTDFDPAINRTHDFFALQIDRNFDGKELGSVESPDDVLVINQYINESVDAFAEGNVSFPFRADATVSGTDDGDAKVKVLDGASDEVSYEFVKPLKASDSNDFDINNSNGLKFRFVAWFNETGNATFSASQQTEWFTIRLNATGTGFTEAKLVTSTRVLLDVGSLDNSDADSLTTLFSLSGYNISIVNSTESDVAISAPLIVPIGDVALPSDFIDEVVERVSIGGAVMIFLTSGSEDAISSANSLLKEFKLKVGGLLENSDNSTLLIDSFGEQEFVFGSKSLFTDEPVESVKGTAYALNRIDLDNSTLSLSQKYMAYDFIPLPDNVGVDEDDDGSVANDEILSPENYTVSIGMDFLYGGRAVISTLNLLSTDHVLDADNLPLTFRMLSWVTKETHALVGNNLTISANEITQGEEISISANVTDLFNNALDEQITIEATVLQAGDVASKVELVSTPGGTYSGSVAVQTIGWQELRVTASAEGYGFYLFDDNVIFVERDFQGFNTGKNPLLIGIALATVGATVFFTQDSIKRFVKKSAVYPGKEE